MRAAAAQRRRSRQRMRDAPGPGLRVEYMQLSAEHLSVLGETAKDDQLAPGRDTGMGAARVRCHAVEPGDLGPAETIGIKSKHSIGKIIIHTTEKIQGVVDTREGATC
eukprot:gb/GECH01004693.1/.p1 GENE.gb/GECH01004693.1/~~gb/GECH01004693.1/.p1  ORF type:complete len:108 (+),score=22.58 gb/GECH01004693.1/:1-324(+)